MHLLRVSVHVACLIAVLGAAGTVLAQQNLRERAREQAARDPGNPILAPPSSPGHFEPKTIEELTREADVVVHARLTRPHTYLELPNEARVFTDYSIDEVTVLSSAFQTVVARTPGIAPPPLLLTVYGGNLTIDGVLIRGSN